MRMAVAGEDRTVVAYDLRKPSTFIGTWASCLKYEVCAAHTHWPLARARARA